MFGVQTHARRSCLKALLFVITVLIWLGIPADVSALTTNQLITLTNQQRQTHGLAPLQHNEQLQQSAFAKAQDMLAKNYWSHNAPDGIQPWQFISHSGYAFVAAGENLAKDFKTDTGVINGWMNSPTHRDNVLNAKYEDIGLAVVEGSLNGVPTTLVVAHYGKPTNRQNKAVSNQSQPTAQPSLPNFTVNLDPTLQSLRRQFERIRLQFVASAW